MDYWKVSLVLNYQNNDCKVLQTWVTANPFFSGCCSQHNLKATMFYLMFKHALIPFFIRIFSKRSREKTGFFFFCHEENMRAAVNHV